MANIKDIKDLYFVQKEGYYPQGIYGIFDKELDAIQCAETSACMDTDSHHTWVVYRYLPPNHKEIYTTNKNDMENSENYFVEFYIVRTNSLTSTMTIKARSLDAAKETVKQYAHDNSVGFYGVKEAYKTSS